jgi:hypothetical protein
MRLAGSLMEEEDECASPQTSLPEASEDDLTDEYGSQARHGKRRMNALLHRAVYRRQVRMMAPMNMARGLAYRK